ncbi:MAG: T9SS type A sorting domain-containing protein [bacterium]
MKLIHWCYLGIPLLIGATMLVASQKAPKQLPPDQSIWFTIPGKYVGRPLTTEERATIQQAIDAVRTPPPSSITYNDAFLQSHTVSCQDIADALQRQLDRGAMEAETLKKSIDGVTLIDGKQTSEGDEMNLNSAMLRAVGANSTLRKYLQEVLVHEFIHKTQLGEGTTREEKEIEAYSACLVYMDSLGLDTTDAFCRAIWETYWALWCDYISDDSMQVFLFPPFTWTQEQCAFIRLDSTGLGPDYFTSFELGAQLWYQYDLSPTRASDMIIFDDYFQFPAGHSLVVICGGADASGMGRIITFDLYQGQIQMPYETHDFGPPEYPPMFLRSMTRCMFSGLYFAINAWYEAEYDEIVAMSDDDYDNIPESIISTYARSSWPGFGALRGMRGVDVAGYDFFRGFGLLVNHDDVHIEHQIDPYATYLFLPDANYDRIADACETVYAYEFLYFTPHIQVPLPVEGDQVVQLFATWMHNIQVWASDSLGENLSELLGSVQMTNGVDAECALSRILVEGEYILPVDQTTGQQPRLATRVGRDTGVDEIVPPLPDQFALWVPFPNPFNATTTLRFELPRAAWINLRIYDVLGREAAILAAGMKPAGSYTAIWNAADSPSGVYFARMETNGFAQTRKLLLVK